MAVMRYEARTLEGAPVNGTLDVENETDLRIRLSVRGLEVVRAEVIAETKRPGVALKRHIPRRRIGTRILAENTGQLALMLKTGTPLVESMAALAQQTEDLRMQEVLESVAASIRGGSTLTEALAAHPHAFDDFYVSTARAGEATGELAEVFKRIESQLIKRLELQSSITAALIYPLIVSLLAIGAVIFVVTYVLPKFIVIFERSHVPLPLPTRMLMFLAGTITTYWYMVPVILIGVPMGLYFFLKTEFGSQLYDRVVLRMPIMGPLAHLVYSGVVLRTLGSLMGAGVPLVESLSICLSACKNRRYKAFIADVSARVMRGEPLAAGFQASPLISPSIKQMVNTGERAGALPVVLNAVSDHLDALTDKRVKRLSAIFEPLIIIVMGIVIGFIAISVLLPLFRLSSAARGGA